MKGKHKHVLVPPNTHQLLMFLRAEWKLNSLHSVIEKLYEDYEKRENE